MSCLLLRPTVLHFPITIIHPCLLLPISHIVVTLFTYRPIIDINLLCLTSVHSPFVTDNFKFCTINVRCIPSKVSAFSFLIFFMILTSFLLLKCDCMTKLLTVKLASIEYNLFRHDRSFTCGGGVCINSHSRPVTFDSLPPENQIWSTLSSGKQTTILIGAKYRPSSSLYIFDDNLCFTLL